MTTPLLKLLSNAKTRTLVLLAIVILSIGVIIAVMSMNKVGGPLENRPSKTTQVPQGVESTPGAKTSERYRELQEKANTVGSEKAEKKGSTFIPTIVADNKSNNNCELQNEFSSALNPNKGKTAKNNAKPTKKLDLAAIMAAHPELKAIIAANPVLAAMFAKNPELAEMVAQYPELAEMLAKNPVLATLLAKNPELAAILAAHPELAAMLAKNPELAAILAKNPELAELLAKNPELAAMLAKNPALAAMLAKNPELADLLLKNPMLVDMLAKNPALAAMLAKNPELADMLAKNPELADMLAKNPMLAEMLAKNPALAAMLAAHPELADMIAKNPELADLLAQNPELADLLLNNPELAMQMIATKNPRLAKMLSQQNKNEGLLQLADKQRQTQLSAEKMTALSEQRSKAIETVAQAMEEQTKAAFNAWTETPQQTYISSSNKTSGDKETNSKDKHNSADTTDTRAVVLKAGTILFAVLETAINSDEPGPIMAKLVQPPFKDAKLMGTIAATSGGAEKLTLHFDTMSIPTEPMSNKIAAVAIDPDTARTALASDVDHHYLLRYGTLFGSAFLQGYAQSVASAGTTTASVNSTTGTASSTTTAPLNPKQQLFAGVAQMGTKMGNQFGKVFDTKPTITIKAGTGLGILVLADVKLGPEPKADPAMKPQPNNGQNNPPQLTNNNTVPQSSNGNLVGLANTMGQNAPAPQQVPSIAPIIPATTVNQANQETH